MRALPLLFSFSLFFAAFLSFSVQPILGKMLLPMVGGSPSGWIVAMAFFQLSLLAGYAISYGLGKLSPWAHAAGLIALYGAGAFFLPPQLPVINDESGLSVQVMLALGQTILLPFLALTATTAALQRIFANTIHPTANDPYYLFVASNLGSFAGLLIYPFLLEPSIDLKEQALYWQGIYIAVIGFIALSAAMAWSYRRAKVTPNSVEDIHNKIEGNVTVTQILRWTALAFVPCSLSMGVTNLITTDIGGVPLFWVIPLGLYLLTFMLAFASRPWVSTKQLNFLHAIAVLFVVIAFGMGRGYQPVGNIVFFLVLVTLLLAVFFIIAWSCHQMLANSRPNPRHLTLYYLVIAFGGALAGLLHGFIIPVALPYLVEFPLAVFLSLFFLPTPAKPKLKRWLTVSCVLAVIILVAISYFKLNNAPTDSYSMFYSAFFFLVLFLAIYPRLLLIVGVVALISGMVDHYPGRVLVQGRNFFGPYAVYETEQQDGTHFRYLVHGNTIHGSQKKGKNGYLRTKISNGYYVKGNPIQEVLDVAQAKSLAVLGLGSGQMACYYPQAVVDFYEIDPDMQMVAENYFTYLKECPPRDVFIGDGRRRLETEARQYDVIMMDAFTSDTVPLHLLTRDALAIYRNRLTADGVLLFHVSNRFLKLAPPLAATAQAEGLQAFRKTFTPKDSRHGSLFMSQWVAVPVSEKATQALLAKGWQSIHEKAAPWSDDRSSLVQAISTNTVFY